MGVAKHGKDFSKGNAVLEKAQSPQAQSFNAYDRPHGDLREFIARAERAGQIVRIAGADWKLEMGTLAEIVNHARPEPPAILFEEVPGYPKGMRLLSGATNSSKRLAIALGLPAPDNPLDVVRAYRDRMKTHRPIPPKTVAKGPVFENIDRDGKVDVLKFPVPFLHEHDGGRYIGTDDLVIMRDPEANWVNGGTYRAMVQDKTHVSVWISPGKHGRQIREKYFRAGKPCPVLISCGHDPLLFLAGGNELKFGLCEYDYAGGHRGEPYEIVLSELHGLPMPGACGDRARRGDGRDHQSEGRTVRRVHGLLRLEPARAAAGGGQARLLSQRSDPRHRLADAPAIRFLLQQMRDEGRHDLGRGRAGGTVRGLPACGCTNSAARACSTSSPSGRPIPAMRGRPDCWRPAASRAPISGVSSPWSTRTSTRATSST